MCVFRNPKFLSIMDKNYQCQKMIFSNKCKGCQPASCSFITTDFLKNTIIHKTMVLSFFQQPPCYHGRILLAERNRSEPFLPQEMDTSTVQVDICPSTVRLSEPFAVEHGRQSPLPALEIFSYQNLGIRKIKQHSIFIEYFILSKHPFYLFNLLLDIGLPTKKLRLKFNDLSHL